MEDPDRQGHGEEGHTGLRIIRTIRSGLPEYEFFAALGLELTGVSLSAAIGFSLVLFLS